MAARAPTRVPFDPANPRLQQGSYVVAGGTRYTVQGVRLGKGAQGVVIKVRAKRKDWAAKVYPASAGALRDRLQQVVNLDLCNRHPVLVGPVQVLDPPFLGTIQPLVQGTPLRPIELKGPTICEMLEVGLALSDGLLNAPYRCHGDLGRKNIILRYHAGRLVAVALIDHEGCPSLQPELPGIGYGGRHLAPECLDASATLEQRFTATTDVFTVALHLLERISTKLQHAPAFVATGKNKPTLAEDTRASHAMLRRWRLNRVRLRKVLRHFPRDLQDVIAGALSPNPEARPGHRELRDTIARTLRRLGTCSTERCFVGGDIDLLTRCPRPGHSDLVSYEARYSKALLATRPGYLLLESSKHAIRLRLDPRRTHVLRRPMPSCTPPRGLLQGLNVSRRHARLRRGNSGWEVKDLGSKAGTRIDHISLPPQSWRPLPAGSLLSIGGLELQVREEA